MLCFELFDKSTFLPSASPLDLGRDVINLISSEIRSHTSTAVFFAVRLPAFDQLSEECDATL